MSGCQTCGSGAAARSGVRAASVADGGVVVEERPRAGTVPASAGGVEFHQTQCDAGTLTVSSDGGGDGFDPSLVGITGCRLEESSASPGGDFAARMTVHNGNDVAASFDPRWTVDGQASDYATQTLSAGETVTFRFPSIPAPSTEDTYSVTAIIRNITST